MTTAEKSTRDRELRDMVVQLSRLVEISVTLNSTLDVELLLQFIIDSAAQLVNSEAASILLVNENTRDLYFAAAHGSDPEELAKIPVPLQGSIAGTIYREDRPLIINQVASDPRHYTEVGEKINLEVRTLAGVPMRIQDKRIGVLEAVNKRGESFNENDVQMLSIIASQAAVAIHNARLLEALQKAYDELGKLDRLKSDFIAIASHELRTPLSMVLGYAAILQEEADETSSEYVSAVLNSAMRMRSLIEDMTNMNMIRIGSAEMSFHPRRLGPILQSAHDELEPLMSAKNQTCTVSVPEDPITADVDEEKLQLALTNLINNSIRFTPPDGKISLQLSQQAHEARLVVSDTGIGLSEDQLEAIFTQFYQVEDHMTRTHEGMGLGLAIVKAIVEAHRGRVWAESNGINQGTRITLAIPMSKS